MLNSAGRLAADFNLFFVFQIGSLVWLTQQPSHVVTVASHCDPAAFVEISPEAWETPRALSLGKCDVIVCRSIDRRYEGLHVRIRDPDEKIGEWVAEEVFEADEGPARALAPLERSRSAFDFLSAPEFSCKKINHRLVCSLPNTNSSVPFIIADPKGGLDDDGWNGFPVVMIVAAGHPLQKGLAGIHASQHIAQSWRPRRGRLVIVPALNLNNLLGDDSLVGVADLNSDYASNEPTSILAQSLWRLCAVLRPDLFFDLGEAPLLDGKIVSTPEAVPLAELMTKEAGQKFILVETPMVLGGLAVKLRNSFKTRAIQVQASFDESASLGMRATALLHMVATTLVSGRVTTSDFQWNVPKMQDCIALRGDSCISAID